MGSGYCGGLSAVQNNIKACNVDVVRRGRYLFRFPWTCATGGWQAETIGHKLVHQPLVCTNSHYIPENANLYHRELDNTGHHGSNCGYGMTDVMLRVYRVYISAGRVGRENDKYTLNNEPTKRS